MSDATRTDNLSSRSEEERLAQGLISRGLITREEALQARPDAPGAERFLTRLVEAGFLTASQARRLRQELPQLLLQQIPGLQLLDKLGQGAMGTVYKARQLSMNRLVAVKVLNARLLAKTDYLERFYREARLAARLSHVNVVQAIDVGMAGDVHYFVMEYVEGKTIRQELDWGRVYTEQEALEIALQVARALAHAHARGLIHRDVKPANIIVTPDGAVKLADLGLAREKDDVKMARKERLLIIGTPHYISPEQVVGREKIDGRADLYSLGATLYHMVTGRPPFPYKDEDAILEAHLKEKPIPPEQIVPELSVGLGDVIAHLMARRVEKRYQSAEELIADLERLQQGLAPINAPARPGTLAELELVEEDELEEVEELEEEEE